MNKTFYTTGKAKMTTVSPGVVLLHVPPISDPQACDKFEAFITKALATKPRLVVVDLSEADSVSTVMLGLLLKLRSAATAAAAEVRLAEVQPMVLRVLNICRLDQLFGVYSSTAAAISDNEQI